MAACQACRQNCVAKPPHSPQDCMRIMRPRPRRSFHREAIMAVDGTWSLTMDTPTGERASTPGVQGAGGKLEGTTAAEGQTAQIFEGRVDGNDVGWKVSITQPMPLTLDFSGTVRSEEHTSELQSH